MSPSSFTFYVNSGVATPRNHFICDRSPNFYDSVQEYFKCHVDQAQRVEKWGLQ
nr:MAG TPA: hypothetical protein [Caudoviricetes sp.]